MDGGKTATCAVTVEEKAAQMILAGCTDENVGREFCSSGAGGLCLFAQPFEYKSAEQVREMTAGFQTAAKIPLLLSVDEEGGTVNRVVQGVTIHDHRDGAARP